MSSATSYLGDRKIEYAYDYMNRRVEKKVSTYDGSSWDVDLHERYVYDQWNLVMVLNGASSNAIVKKYTWGLDLSGTIQGAGGVGGLLAVLETSTSNNYWYLYDANGNVGQVLDASDQSVDAKYEYDPYGNEILASGTYTTNPFRFSTKWQDTCSAGAAGSDKYYYYGHRYLMPRTGRWTNRDPIGERGGHNLYAYVSNNCIGSYDPLGLDPPQIGDPGFDVGPGTQEDCAACIDECMRNGGGRDYCRAGPCLARCIPGQNGPNDEECRWGCRAGVGIVILGGVSCTAVAAGTATPPGWVIAGLAVCCTLGAAISYEIIRAEPIPRTSSSKWKCTIKAREWPVGTDCYGKIFSGTGSTKAIAEEIARQKCYDAGCHQAPGNCGHLTCYKTN